MTTTQRFTLLAAVSIIGALAIVALVLFAPVAAHADEAPDITTAPVDEAPPVVVETAPTTPVDEAPPVVVENPDPIPAPVETVPPAPVDEAPPVATDLPAWDYWAYPETGDRSSWVLDCATATWWLDVRHYHAEQTAPGIYGEVTVTVERVELGAATGNDLSADCPNWVTDSNGNWYDANVTPAPETYPEALPLDPITDEPALKVGLAIVYKIGLSR